MPGLWLGGKDHLHVIGGPQTWCLHSQRPCEQIRGISLQNDEISIFGQKIECLQAGSGEKTVSGTSKRVRVGKDRR